MSLAVAWLAFPLALGLVCLGCGLGLERLARLRLPGVLVLPSGLAVVVVVGVVTTTTRATASLTVPAVVALAVAGSAVSVPRLRRPDPWAALAAAAAYAAYAAPVVLSGSATFAGYVKLDDTSAWLGLTDQIMQRGRDLAGLAPSSYEATMRFYLQVDSYPVGSFVPLGVGRALVRGDVAWLFQPYLALLGAFLGLAAYALLVDVVRSRALRAGAACVGAQSALLYGYALWGGLKEVAAAFLVLLVAALARPLLEEAASLRQLVPLAVAVAALVGVLGGVGAGFAAPVVGPVLLLLAYRRRSAARLAPRRWLATALAAGVAVAIAVFAAGTVPLDSLTGAGGSPDYLGNLVAPLDPLQLLGIWPSADFRLPPADAATTDILLAALAAAAALGLAAAARRRAWLVPGYVCGTLAACGVVGAVATPWIEAKAFAIGSPALPVAALAGAAVLLERGRRVEGAVLAVAIAGGVLWSNVLAYRGVWLAPRDELGELQAIGNRFAGQGPALLTEYQLYGIGHFLRRLDPEGAGTVRRVDVRLQGGATVPVGGYADVDAFELGSVTHFRTLVLDRSPVASRPPSTYGLAWSGRFYEVWQRAPAGGSRLLEHVSLGGPLQPGAVPPCRLVLRVAARAAAAGGRVATVVRRPVAVVPLGPTVHPASWDGPGGLVAPSSAGTLAGTVSVPQAGRYEVWVGGSFASRLQALVDGVPVGSARARLGLAGRYWALGQATLAAGSHGFELRYDGPGLVPGSATRLFLPFGPLVVSPVGGPPAVTTVAPAAARTLCGRRLDWLEAVR